MKSIFEFSTIIFLFLFIFSCNQNENINSDNNLISRKGLVFHKEAFKNKIGYMNNETNKIETISDKQIIRHWKNILDPSLDVKFNKIMLVEAELEEGEEPYFMLNSTSEDGTITICSKIFETENGFIFRGETCVCQSSECAWSGCEVTRMCACSSCIGDCKKTHTHTVLTPESFK